MGLCGIWAQVDGRSATCGRYVLSVRHWRAGGVPREAAGAFMGGEAARCGSVRCAMCCVLCAVCVVR